MEFWNQKTHRVVNIAAPHYGSIPSLAKEGLAYTSISTLNSSDSIPELTLMFKYFQPLQKD